MIEVSYLGYLIEAVETRIFPLNISERVKFTHNASKSRT